MGKKIIMPGENGSGLLIVPGMTRGKIEISYDAEIGDVLIDTRNQDLRVVLQVLHAAIGQVFQILISIASGTIPNNVERINANDEKKDGDEKSGDN